MQEETKNNGADALAKALSQHEEAVKSMAAFGACAPDVLRDLLAIARRDHSGARRVAGVLLSLWDGEVYHCDLGSALYLDSDIFHALLELLAFLAASGKQLDSLIDEGAMRGIIAAWGGAFRVEAGAR